LLLLGESPEGLLLCELDADTGSLVWARDIFGGQNPDQASWVGYSLEPTADGGHVIAAAASYAPVVLKLDRDGEIQWQYEYRAPEPTVFPNHGAAFDVYVRPEGGYRVAGRQTSEQTSYGTPTRSGISWFQEHATVFDLDAEGGISVNDKSGWVRLATAATSTAVSPQPLAMDVEFEDIDMGADADPGRVLSNATNIIVETVSGPDDALAAPPVGSNAEGESFYWGNVAGASGFIVFHSADGVAFTRENRTQDYDFDLHGSGYFRLAAFNGTGYSDYSPVMGPLGSAAPPPPDGYTLRVINSAGGGFVRSTPPGISCGIDCTEQFPPGTEVELTFTEGEYLRFLSWGVGCIRSNAQQCVARMDGDVTVMINYSAPN
jgi:hypothetical protein